MRIKPIAFGILTVALFTGTIGVTMATGAWQSNRHRRRAYAQRRDWWMDIRASVVAEEGIEGEAMMHSGTTLTHDVPFISELLCLVMALAITLCFDFERPAQKRVKNLDKNARGKLNK